MEGGRWWWAWELISLRCKICGNSFTQLGVAAATLICRKTADVHFLLSGNSPLKTLGTILDSILSISSIPSSEKSYPVQWSSIIWWKHSKILVTEQHVIRFKDKSPFCSWKMSAATRAVGREVGGGKYKNAQGIVGQWCHGHPGQCCPHSPGPLNNKEVLLDVLTHRGTHLLPDVVISSWKSFSFFLSLRYFERSSWT